MGDPVLFELPDDTPADLKVAAEMVQALDILQRTLATLAADHAALREIVETRAEAGGPPAPVGRWEALDRVAATAMWVWLINWTGWLVHRYGLHEELGSCWPQHPALVEELRALGLAWHGAFDADAVADGPLRWHEALTRSRARWKTWDEQTKCRAGRHAELRRTVAWPDNWRDIALTWADNEVQAHPAGRADGGERR